MQKPDKVAESLSEISALILKIQKGEKLNIAHAKSNVIG